ncbi:MAG: hypothetical protein HOY79_17705 [Streptomyces sp.]|nr:hypothetical protein [Streptomyces sp.]
MAANTPRAEIRSFLARTNGGFGLNRGPTVCYAVVFEANQWHVLLNAHSTAGAESAIEQWTKRTGRRTAVIIDAADIKAD